MGRTRIRGSLIQVAKVTVGCDMVPDALFECFDIGKSTIFLSVPQEGLVEVNLEHSRDFGGSQSYLTNFIFECAQNFLCHPGTS